jgi:hypothetical protein
MNRILIAGLLFAAMASCKNKSENKEAAPGAGTENNGQNTVAAVAKKVYDKVLGSFVGVFGDNKITLLITKAEGDSVIGRSVVGGNDRPFAGIISQKEGKYIVNAKEPGDDKNDGTFSFTIDEANTDQVQGSWVPNIPKPNGTGQKDYVLKRKSFKYDVNTGTYPKASQRILKEGDVENLTKSELEYMRNEIFARHGYCFKKKELREHFENAEWYIPNTVNVADQLTELEKKNIAMIKRYEKYAEDYGDEYGR